MNLEREELILATGAAEDPAMKLFIDAMENDDVRAYARAYALLLEQGSQRNFAEYLADKILFDDNVFARRAFEGKLSPDVVSAFSHDLDIFQRIADACDNPPPKIGAKLSAGFPKIYRGKNNPLFGGEWSGKRTLSKQKEFFRQNGYGIFVGNKAFTFAGVALAPVKYTSNISLYDLKDYEYEKQLVEDNIISFLKYLTYSIMLLYGDLKFRDTLEYVTNYSVPVGWRSQYCGLFKTERNGVTYYFLDNEYYFKRRGLYGFYDDGERFAFFSRAVLETLFYIDFTPDIINCNDWQTALVPVYLNLYYRHLDKFNRLKPLFALHNIA